MRPFPYNNQWSVKNERRMKKVDKIYVKFIRKADGKKAPIGASNRPTCLKFIAKISTRRRSITTIVINGVFNTFKTTNWINTSYVYQLTLFHLRSKCFTFDVLFYFEQCFLSNAGPFTPALSTPVLKIELKFWAA